RPRPEAVRPSRTSPASAPARTGRTATGRRRSTAAPLAPRRQDSLLASLRYRCGHARTDPPGHALDREPGRCTPHGPNGRHRAIAKRPAGDAEFRVSFGRPLPPEGRKSREIDQTRAPDRSFRGLGSVIWVNGRLPTARNAASNSPGHRTNPARAWLRG